MSRLGGSSAFVGRLGRDSFGDFLLSKLSANGVDTGGVRRVDDCSSSATVVLK